MCESSMNTMLAVSRKLCISAKASSNVISKNIQSLRMLELCCIAGGGYPLCHCSRIVDSNGIHKCLLAVGWLAKSRDCRSCIVKSIDYDDDYIFDKKYRYPSGQSPFMDPITTLGRMILIPMTVWSVYALLFHLGVSESFK